MYRMRKYDQSARNVELTHEDSLRNKQHECYSYCMSYSSLPTSCEDSADETTLW